MDKFIFAGVVGALFTPALALIMSFITWENSFKLLGWNYLLRLSVVIFIAAEVIAYTK